ncbi:hypothetical protein [Pelodictyon luteolum]|nr:hypothetical protein [Pelodictyon luteolum]
MARPRLFQEMKKTFLLHAIAAHFSNGLIPAAVLYLFLSIGTGNVFFEHTVLHLILVTLFAVPVSFFSGMNDWKTKFRGAKAPIFIKKLILAGLLFFLCIAALTIRLAHPDVMTEGGLLSRTYAGMLLAMLPVVTLLGHYGRKLSSQLCPPGKPASPDNPY